jgi:hypothetical protein
VRRSLAGLIALGALVMSAAEAFANDPDQGESADVLTRARPEYDAPGIRVGSFFLYPALAAGFGYSDNVFNDASNIDDYFYSLAPELHFRSSWSRHMLNLTAEATSYWYSDQGSEDRTDWNIGADGRIDIVRGTDIEAEVHFQNLHEPRGTDLTGGFVAGDPAEPTELSRSGFGGAFNHTINRVRLSVGGSVETIDYEDTPTVQPFVPTFINNDDRDRTVTEFFAKAAVEATEDTAVFIRGRINDHDFDTAVDDDGFNRDSSGWTFDGGLEFSMTHVLVGELFAGYTQRSYDDPAFDDTSELAFGAGLKWFPTMLTTLRFDGARTIEDTSITAASGYVSTRGEVGVDHELLRNVILSGRLGYETAEYQDVVRSDDIIRGSVGGRFLINNNLHFDAGWEFIDRNSNALPFEYSTGQFSLALTGKM